MTRLQQLSLLLILSFALSGTAQSEEILFFQDFGCDGSADDGCGAATTPQTWTDTSGDNVEYGAPEVWERTYNWNAANGGGNYSGSNDETVSVGGGTRLWENQEPGLFSVEGSPPDFIEDTSNWNIHDGFDNAWVAGYRTETIGHNNEDCCYTITADNPNMSGNMLGHEDENYNTNEANFYQIDGIVLAADTGDADYSAMLMFDFDSWISNASIYTNFSCGTYGNKGCTYLGKDADAFAVSIISDAGLELLGDDLTEQIADNDLIYTNQRCNAGTALGSLSGQACDNGNYLGYDGHNQGGVNVPMAGTALFDLSDFAGQTISLRFSFASDAGLNYHSSSTVAEGINIDNIKVTQTCVGDGCDDPNTEVPEPATLALALLGATAAWRSRRLRGARQHA